MTETTEPNGLEVTEYVSVAGSVAGTLVAVFSQQLIYSVAPLTLALSLSLINRRRFEQTLQQNMAAVLSEMGTRVRQIDREISEEMGSLRDSFQGFSTPIKPLILAPVQEELSQLRERFDSLEQAIGNLTISTKPEGSASLSDTQAKQIDELTPGFDSEYLDRKIEELKTELLDRKQIGSENLTKEEFQDFKQQIQQLQTNLSSLTEAFKEREEIQRIEELRQMLLSPEVEQRISQLADASANVVPSYLERQVRELQANVSSLTEAFNQRQDLERIQEVKQIAAEVQEQLAAFTPQPVTFDPSYLEEQIQQLATKVSQIGDRFTERLAEQRESTSDVEYELSALPTQNGRSDTGYVAAQIKEIKAAIAQTEEITRSNLDRLEAQNQQMQATLQSLTEAFEERSQPAEIEELKQSAAEVELLQQVSAITSDLDNSYLQAEIQQLKKELQALYFQIPQSNSYAEKADRTFIEDAYTKLNAAVESSLDFSSAKFQQLSKCASHWQQQLLKMPKQIAQSPEKSDDSAESDLLLSKSAASTLESRDLDTLLTYWTESLVARSLQVFDNLRGKRQQQTEAVETEIIGLPHQTIDLPSEQQIQQMQYITVKSEVVSSPESKLKNDLENKAIGVETPIQTPDAESYENDRHSDIETPDRESYETNNLHEEGAKR
ncbi:hypothetical protein H6S82_09750 [Planktothrix sp. FACHB-1355]|uniref:Uncharacterized protein n=1 Tax=Aerosakkonema funiforme FACHB-1375 TaxID=2949571 RepID=A0A926VDZ8_9CYAN|nr:MULTISPECIES: hypothetical protein [Oscillatoriales]MBD2181982.1 hypothetical protein [Aerosakkonema funiforme FACHB-1375]MBD3559142.1 hypothetical protein [Planktothrix sp. FACHB-1355]